MMKTTRTNEANTTDWHESAFDIIRGLAAYTGSSLVEGLAEVVARYPDADLGTAFNHKQVGCKIWARDSLFESLGGNFNHIVVLGGWWVVEARPRTRNDGCAISQERPCDAEPDPLASARDEHDPSVPAGFADHRRPFAAIVRE